MDSLTEALLSVICNSQLVLEEEFLCAIDYPIQCTVSSQVGALGPRISPYP